MVFLLMVSTWVQPSILWSLHVSIYQFFGLYLSPSTNPQSFLISSNQSSGLHSSSVTRSMVSLYLQPLVLVVSPCFQPTTPLVSPCLQLPSFGLWLSSAISPLVSPCL
jgi:hypothetical protein